MLMLPQCELAFFNDKTKPEPEVGLMVDFATTKLKKRIDYFARRFGLLNLGRVCFWTMAIPHGIEDSVVSLCDSLDSDSDILHDVSMRYGISAVAAPQATGRRKWSIFPSCRDLTCGTDELPQPTAQFRCSPASAVQQSNCFGNESPSAIQDDTDRQAQKMWKEHKHRQDLDQRDLIAPQPQSLR